MKNLHLPFLGKELHSFTNSVPCHMFRKSWSDKINFLIFKQQQQKCQHLVLVN